MGATSETETVACCLCRESVSPSGWCHNCRTWPINVTPIRYCQRAHRVNPDGWCRECAAFVATELLPENGEWRDTGYIPKRLAKSDVQAFGRQVAATLSSPGWPEKAVPLNRRFIPRRWKRAKLVVVGRTPNGDEIVIPDEFAAKLPEVFGEQDESVPF